jgi:hypothetical protein
MRVLKFVQVVHFFGPAYAADVSAILAVRLLPKFQVDFFLGAVAFASLIHVPPIGGVLAALLLVFVCGLAAAALFWLLGLKQSWI